MFEVSAENKQNFICNTCLIHLLVWNNSCCVCGLTNSMTANHWVFFVIPSWMVIVFKKKKEDTGFPPIVCLASPWCAEPNGLWDWWSGNEHTCWNQPAIHRSPTIKAIQFLFWNGAGQVLRTVCLCMLSYCRLSVYSVFVCMVCVCVRPHMCTTVHKNMSGLVNAEHGYSCSL